MALHRGLQAPVAPLEAQKEASISTPTIEGHSAQQTSWMKTFETDVKILAQKLGREVRWDLQAGDTGFYRGSVELAGQRFGLMEQKEGVKLVAYEKCHALHQGEKFTLAHSRGRQDSVLEIKSLLSKGRDLGGMEIEF